LRRIDRTRAFAEGAIAAIKGFGDLIDNLNSIIGGDLAKVARDKVLEVIGNQAGRAAPGIEDSRIQNALSSALEWADKKITDLAAGIARRSPLLGAIGRLFLRHGEVAEKLTIAVLEHSGLFRREGVQVPGGPDREAIGPIQNNSNHGIDFVGRALTGAYTGQFVVFEIKAGLNGLAPGLRGDQRSGANFFANSRVGRAAAGGPLWGPSATPYGTQEYAKFVQQEMIRQEVPRLGHPARLHGRGRQETCYV
jgi:hypothetical protein